MCHTAEENTIAMNANTPAKPLIAYHVDILLIIYGSWMLRKAVWRVVCNFFSNLKP